MVVFTVITGGYDTLKPVLHRNEAWRYVCLTDNPDIYPNGWEILPIDQISPPHGLNLVKLQRWTKIYGSPKFFKCPTIYLDGSHVIIKDVTALYDPSADAVLKLHPARSCYMEEATACIRLNKASREAIIGQVSGYESKGLPNNSGMYETGILIRAWNERVDDFNGVWWSEIDNHTHRDQLSIMWALRGSEMIVTEITNETFKKYIKIHQHSGKAQ